MTAGRKTPDEQQRAYVSARLVAVRAWAFVGCAVAFVIALVALGSVGDAVKCLLDVAGRARLVPQLHRFQVVGDEVVDDGRRDGLLVGKVVVEQRPRHAAALADVLHGRAGKALLFVQLPRRIDDLLPALIAHVCHLPKRLRVPRFLKRFDGFRIRGSLTHRQ